MITTHEALAWRRYAKKRQAFSSDPKADRIPGVVSAYRIYAEAAGANQAEIAAGCETLLKRLNDERGHVA